MKALPFILVLFVSTLIGCQTPAEKQEKAAKKVAQKEEQIKTNQVAQVKKGVGMSDAALHILGKNPEPTVYDDVAKMSLETSMLAFQAADMMPPSYEILKYRQMVEDLISTNAQIKASASNQLNVVRQQLAATEKREQSLSGELGKLQEKLDAVNAENAAMATTWSTIKRIFWWAVWIIAGGFIIKLASVIVPPPYNSALYIVDHIVGGFVRMVFAVFGKAKDAANVVSKQAHDLSETTLRQVVDSVQQVREKNPEVKALLDQVLKDETDKNSTRLKITEVKRELGYV